MLWRRQTVFDERAVNHELRCRIRQLVALPRIHLVQHGGEVPVHAVDRDRENVLGHEVLGMLAGQGLEVAVEGEVVADEDLVADRDPD